MWQRQLINKLEHGKTHGETKADKADELTMTKEKTRHLNTLRTSEMKTAVYDQHEPGVTDRGHRKT